MRLVKLWCHALAAALATGLSLVVFAPAAMAAPNVCGPWHNQQDMADSSGSPCRSTWLVDPGQGQYLDRGDLLAAADLYNSHGFDRQWLWYAPETSVHIPVGSNQEWTSCPVDLHHGGACPAGATLLIHRLLNNFTGSVDMSVFAYDGRVVSRVCGNYFYPLSSTRNPLPTITGHKFNDRNRNGGQDGDEPGLGGWTFQLVRNSSLFGDQAPGFVTSTTTGGDGSFAFALNGVGPGTYTVSEVPQNDWAPTTAASQTVVVPAGIGDADVANLAYGNYFQQIAASGSAIVSTEGLSYSGVVATFTDPDPAGTAGEYEATINWGDGTPTIPGAVLKSADGSFAVNGSHVYVEESAHVLTVNINDIDNPANSATVNSTANISDAPLTGGAPNTIHPTEGNSFSGVVGTFTDVNPFAPVGDFTATINWGDGTPTTTGSVAGPTGGPFTVSAGHTYVEEGTYALTVNVADEGGSTTTLAGTAAVVDAPLTGGAPNTIHATEGNPFSGVVGTFTDANPFAPVGDFTATINWGDGTPTTTGSVAGPTGGPFTVSAGHTYVEEGTYALTINVADEGGSTTTIGATAEVVDAPLTATGNPNLLSTNPLTGLAIATFTDGNPFAPAADFTVTIDWGDGTSATTGTVTGPAGGPFAVSGGHTYATLGPKTITARILDEGGSRATAVSHVIVYGFAQGGNFVIGDGNTAVGTHANFWGAQWWQHNTLSGGAGPASFKGFADGPIIASCGAAWTATTGNSSHPPETVPTYMAVIVSGNVVQSGSKISGHVDHVVIVRTDPGYAGNPGHEGTGEIVAIVC